MPLSVDHWTKFLCEDSREAIRTWWKNHMVGKTTHEAKGELKHFEQGAIGSFRVLIENHDLTKLAEVLGTIASLNPKEYPLRECYGLLKALDNKYVRRELSIVDHDGEATKLKEVIHNIFEKYIEICPETHNALKALHDKLVGLETEVDMSIYD